MQPVSKISEIEKAENTIGVWDTQVYAFAKLIFISLYINSTLKIMVNKYQTVDEVLHAEVLGAKCIDVYNLTLNVWKIGL